MRDIVNYWRLSDITLVLLKDTPLFRTVIPFEDFRGDGDRNADHYQCAGRAADRCWSRSGAAEMIEPSSLTALVDAIERLVQDPARRQALVVRRRRRRPSDTTASSLRTRLLDALQALSNKAGQVRWRLKLRSATDPPVIGAHIAALIRSKYLILMIFLSVCASVTDCANSAGIAFVYLPASGYTPLHRARDVLPGLQLQSLRKLRALDEESDCDIRHAAGSHQDGAGRHRTAKKPRPRFARLRHRAASRHIGPGAVAVSRLPPITISI